MNCIVESCELCGGFCCRAITLDMGIRAPQCFKKINGLQALGKNPFLPLHELVYLSKDVPVEFYSCDKLKDGLCSCYDNRMEMCKRYPVYQGMDQLLHFVFVVPWCHYRMYRLILENEDYEFKTLQECLDFYSDPSEERWFSGISPLDCYRFNSLYKQVNHFPLITPSSVNDWFLQEVFNGYLVHFIYRFKRATIKLSSARNSFHKASLLCYKYGLSPEAFWNIASLYGQVNRVPGQFPFPTYIAGEAFEEFVISRLDKLRDRETLKHGKTDEGIL
jgi:hypothetical protein